MTATTQRPLLVGIAGASASGKSLLAKTIKQRLPIEHIQVISEDSYYFDQSHLTMEEREKTIMTILIRWSMTCCSSTWSS